MFKFVHIADIHLDSAIKSNPKHQQLILDEIQKAFVASVDLCINEKCHALLISGDLLDNESLFYYKTELMLRESFERLARKGIRVFYCLGNHDSKSTRIKSSFMGDNVFVFDNETPKTVSLKDADSNVIGIVTGVGYSKPRVEENISKKFNVANNDFNAPIVAMLHTSMDVGGDKAYAPCTYEDLQFHNFDYWALGHIHKTQVYDKGVPAVFPGCICGRDFGETGEKGAFLVELNKQGISRYEFVELAGITWHDMEVTGFENAQVRDDIAELCIKEVIKKTSNSKKNMVRLKLKGQCSIYNKLTEDDIITLQENIARQTGANVTVVNNLISLLNPDDYIDDSHILSVALNIARQAKTDDVLKDEIIEALSQEYRGLDGGEDSEYVNSLFENIESRLLDTMIKRED